MDKVDALFAIVGFLTIAYLLSYPVEWAVTKVSTSIHGVLLRFAEFVTANYLSQ